MQVQLVELSPLQKADRLKNALVCESIALGIFRDMFVQAYLPAYAAEFADLAWPILSSVRSEMQEPYCRAPSML